MAARDQRRDHSSQQAARNGYKGGCCLDAYRCIQMNDAAELAESNARARNDHGVTKNNGPGAS